MVTKPRHITSFGFNLLISILSVSYFYLQAFFLYNFNLYLNTNKLASPTPLLQLDLKLLNLIYI